MFPNLSVLNSYSSDDLQAVFISDQTVNEIDVDDVDVKIIRKDDEILLIERPENINDEFPYDRVLLIGNADNLKLKQLFEFTQIKWLGISMASLSRLPLEIAHLINLVHLEIQNARLTSLPPDISHLSMLTHLQVANSKLNTLPGKICELTNLTTLDISDNQLDSLPIGFENLTQLSELDIRGNQFRVFPNQITHLPNLKNLYLSNNQLLCLPGEINALSNLVELYLSNCQIALFPQEIGELSNLTELSLSNNQFQTFPEEIFRFQKLARLYLSDNQLVNLPNSIGELKNLEELDLSGNQFTSIPEEIAQLTNLKELFLSKNRLKILPSEIGELSNLTELSLSSNQFQTFPEEIFELQKLAKLYLSNNQLTNLPNSIGELKNLEVLDISGNRFTSIPEEVTQLTKLTELNLNGNYFNLFPPTIIGIPNLSKLYLSDNQLSSIPNELSRIEHLTVLDLSGTQIDSLPTEIGNLSELHELILSNNQLSDLPKGVAKLLNLNKLNLSKNQLSVLPVEIGVFSKLIELNLSDNQLSILPDEIENLLNLKTLNLSNNQFALIPEGITKLSKLEKLYLTNNRLKKLLEQISNLSNLRELAITGNQITSLPSSISQFTRLTVLYAVNNSLTDIPHEIGSLSRLEELYLNTNQILALPKEIEQLKNLRILNLSGNQFSIFPTEILSVKTLEKLAIDDNKLTYLPKEITQLTQLINLSIASNLLSELSCDICKNSNLTELNISWNRISILPIEIGQLKNLEKLNLSGNQLDFLPGEIGNLRSLKELDLSVNGLTSLTSYITDLSSLQLLDISSNRLTTLPEKIHKLQNLQFLDIANNRLIALPNEICELKQLSTLRVNNFDFRGNNKLTKLPLEIYKLKNLTELNLLDNPLPIPPEIIYKTYAPQSILNFLFSLANKQKNSLNEIKLVFIGQGSVGKTSLVHRILFDTYNLTDISMTKGISIKQWSTFIEKNTDLSTCEKDLVQSEIQINIWDFGGQEIMHATHQFFLTQRSLYILVIDTRLTQEENRIEYWLKIIQSFGGNSPVLIVGNKIDQKPLDIDISGLKKKYPNIADVLSTSAVTGEGVDTLKSAIMLQIKKIPHIYDELPETWLTVKTHLRKLGDEKNYITYDEYCNLCSFNEITDHINQNTLIGLLHDLGIVLFFRDDPRLEALGILNPQWVTNGVYKILNSHALFQNKGVLTVSMLDEILNLPEYPRGKRLFIVDMMKKFELCYDIEPDKTFLVPDLLPKDEPAELKFNGVPAFEYAYPVLPSSVITRFIVRMNQKIEDGLVWRTGVVLKIGENKALVKADIEDRKITIAIDGMEHTRRDALLAVCTHLDEIHDSIKGLNPEKLIPVPGAVNAKPLSYNYLLMLEAKGVEVLPVPDGNSLIDVNIRKVLSGVPNEIRPKEGASNVTTIYNVNTGGGDFTGGDKSISAGDHSIVIGGNVSDSRISSSYSKVNSAEINPELKDTLLQLGEAVDAMLQKLPAEQAAEVAEDFGKLADEAVKPKPNKKWYSVSIEGLIKAAENLDKLGTPVISLSRKVLSILISDIKK